MKATPGPPPEDRARRELSDGGSPVQIRLLRPETGPEKPSGFVMPTTKPGDFPYFVR